MQFIFDLDAQDGWPPFSAESLHFAHVGEGYKVKSLPFFIHNVAYDDILDLEIFEGGRAMIRGVLSRSGNKTLWVYFRDIAKSHDVLSQLSAAGVGYEGGVIEGYFSVNIPSCDAFELFNALLAPLERDDLVEVVEAFV